MPGNEVLANTLANKLNIEMGSVEIRTFPDGEYYVCIHSDVKDKTAILICTLNHPNDKILLLMFVAQTLKKLGANKIYLVSPYLPYMRQDKQFHPGEAVTSYLFATFVSTWLDGLITIDPHLHRIKKLSEIYSIPSISVLHATKKIAEWIRQHVDSPFLIGPDEESKQWINEVAEYANAPFVICKKIRYGDRNVEISIPEIKHLGSVPVLVDDIISTGTSMTVILQQLVSHGYKNSICISVHALFDDEVQQNLIRAGATKIMTCNTIIHASNQIDLTDDIANCFY